MAPGTYDVVLVGGGVMGCATAYHLLRLDERLRVALIEQDATYARASTTLSDGNMRVQFNIRENIQMSLYGLEVLARFADELAVGDDRPDPGFRRQGNLFVVDDSLAGLNIVFAGSVLSNTLAGGYTSRAFIRAFDVNFTQVLAGAEVDLLDGQPFQVTFQSTPDHAHIEYGFDTIGPNARVGSSLGSVVIATVPEPSAWAMMVAGLLGVAALRRRGQRS